ncbi:hypothetical protein ACKLNO_01500 [Neisseriaceae bacterium B1]
MYLCKALNKIALIVTDFRLPESSFYEPNSHLFKMVSHFFQAA